MKTDLPQFWTHKMIIEFLDYYNKEGCKLRIFQEFFYKSSHTSIDDDQTIPERIKNVNVTYSCYWQCHIPSYLVLSTETDYYKESNIGYVKIVDGINPYNDEPQAKIFAYIKQNLELESNIDKGVNIPLGSGNIITLTLELDRQYLDKYNTTNIVGVELPIRGLEVDYSKASPKEMARTMDR
jgi:hypothetical protein